MTKKMKKNREWSDQEMNRSAQDFVEWYIKQLTSSEENIVQVPFLIEVKNSGEIPVVTIVCGEKEIKEFFEEEK